MPQTAWDTDVTYTEETGMEKTGEGFFLTAEELAGITLSYLYSQRRDAAIFNKVYVRDLEGTSEKNFEAWHHRKTLFIAVMLSFSSG